MTKTPNVIILMADQLRWDALGEHTPHINNLIGDSFQFSRAYCASPLCVPARGSLFTGMYPNQTGSIINPWEPGDAIHGDVREGIPNLYQMMEDQWDSWHVGKQHLYTADRFDKSPKSKTHWITLKDDYAQFMSECGDRMPGGEAFKGIVPEMAKGRITRMKKYSIPTIGQYEPGFDSFYDGFIANRCVDAIKDRNAAKPFLLNAMFLAPHPPYDIPEPWFSMISDVNLPENVGVWYPDQSPLQLYNLPGVNGTKYTRSDWQGVWPVYFGLVALLDHAIGLIIEELKRQDLYDDSVILFMSDHGEMLGSHCLYQKMCMYEESVRTPVVIKMPANDCVVGVTDTVVSAVDILPTVCEIVGLPIPDAAAGNSLLPIMKGDKSEGNEIFIQFDGNGALGNFQRAVVNRRHKLIVDMFKDETYLELYDVIDDPQEMVNLAFDTNYAGTVKDLLQALSGYMSNTGDMISPIVPENAYSTFIADYQPYRASR